jgi:hypothetical protein
MNRVEDANRLQTLQIYKKKEIIPANVRIKRMTNELHEIKMEHLLATTLKKRSAPKEKKPDELIDPPTVKSIDYQNRLTEMEKELREWISDYRDLLDQIREFNRITPKTEHELEKSDQEALENVEKIIKVEELKEKLLAEFETMCIRHETIEEKSRRRIKRLEFELAGKQARIENLEYDLLRFKKNQP